MCNERFQQVQPLQYLCMPPKDCSWKYQEKLLANKLKKENKDERAELKTLKESLLTHKDYVKLLQIVFNTWIRKRDENLPCISCDTPMSERKGDASHYFATTYQFLRFNEDNVHLSCVPCNQFKHGNILEYAPRLEAKIGTDRIQWLHAHRHDRFDMTIEELKEKIIYYKKKIKSI